jgi:hypothetical protein
MTAFQIISASAGVLGACFTVIWFFIRRFITSMDKQIDTMDAIQSKLAKHDTRIALLEMRSGAA